jgi:hypothetical protein
MPLRDLLAEVLEKMKVFAFFFAKLAVRDSTLAAPNRPFEGSY